ncbi:MAG: hypothetical protein E6Q97_28450 [Desulfurellales bacterium]|nr:MAG: hypothetical protein E6Q97_28450 [Desulfurellales bacterium]
MARARNIKPSFFANEFLAARSPAARLLFIGLWTLADREGRLEDRPSRIKGALFPYEDADVNAMLDDLASVTDPFQDSPFIIRYQVAGKRYIQICKFTQHQAPHIKEVASTIPPCPHMESDANSEPARNQHQTSTELAPEIPVQAQCAHGAKSPSSPFPLPESPIPNKKETKKERIRFSRPSVEQVAEYVQQQGYQIDPSAFVDHYEAKGWLIGKSPMKDWKAAVRTWVKNSHSGQQPRAPTNGRMARPLTLEELKNWRPTGVPD